MIQIVRMYIVLAFLFLANLLWAQKKYTISGYIKDNKNGEDLIGATIIAVETKQATSTNAYGFFSLTLTEGTYTIKTEYVGYKSIEKKINLTQNITQNFNISEEAILTEEVLVTERKVDANVSELKMSKVEMNMGQLKKLPALFGEPDIIKLVQLQPGVVSAGEGTGAFFVRGGAADQNLILYDEAPVYDPSHVGGLLSAFNSSIVKSSDLYKGGIPANYGGRLSSVLDIRSIDGNNRRPEGGVSIGLLATRANIQGPIGPQLFQNHRKFNDSTGKLEFIERAPAKASFMLSARRSFVGYLFQLQPNTRNNDVYFYDINAKVNYNIDAKNRVFVSGYFGRDVLKFGTAFTFDWGNSTGTVRWNHIFNSKLFSNTTFIVSNYDYSLRLNNIFTWTAGIFEQNIKQDFTYYINPKNTLTFGANIAYRQFQPGDFNILIPGISSINLQRLAAYDNAIYISNKQELSPRISIEYGARLSIFSNVASNKGNTFYKYEDLNVTGNQIVKKEQYDYAANQHIQTFINPEPRLSGRYMLTPSSSVKASYNRMVQNVHQIVSGIVPLPTSFWLPSTQYLKPQIADQVAGGYFKNFRDNMFEFSVEGFYKYMQNTVDFVDNANVFLNPDLPVYIKQGTGQSYGAELFLIKSKGKFTGQIGYTLSWAKRQVEGVNQNREYFSTYDRRHTLNIVATYEISKRWTLGATFTYQTGRPVSLATGKTQIGDIPINVYSDRNGYRLPDFHRLDLSATLKSKVKPRRWWNSELTFSVYNAYNRKNPFTLIIQPKTTDVPNTDGTVAPGDPIVGTQETEVVLIYAFPVLPSVSYTFNF
ncbi:MAG: TonB-dependent receptor [Bacteroidota bacterium]|nr:TonB-dependent receptor [Bacteroidota bacterium]